jgi:hypothetical protein
MDRSSIRLRAREFIVSRPAPHVLPGRKTCVFTVQLLWQKRQGSVPASYVLPTNHPCLNSTPQNCRGLSRHRSGDRRASPSGPGTLCRHEPVLLSPCFPCRDRRDTQAICSRAPREISPSKTQKQQDRHRSGLRRRLQLKQQILCQLRSDTWDETYQFRAGGKDEDILFTVGQTALGPILIAMVHVASARSSWETIPTPSSSTWKTDFHVQTSSADTVPSNSRWQRSSAL